MRKAFLIAATAVIGANGASAQTPAKMPAIVTPADLLKICTASRGADSSNKMGCPERMIASGNVLVISPENVTPELKQLIEEVVRQFLQGHAAMVKK